MSPPQGVYVLHEAGVDNGCKDLSLIYVQIVSGAAIFRVLTRYDSGTRFSSLTIRKFIELLYERLNNSGVGWGIILQIFEGSRSDQGP